MRAFELLLEQDLSDKDIRAQIIATVKQAERPLLDKIFYVLDSQDFESRIESVLSTDVDAAKIKNNIARIFVTTKGSVQEKKQFLDTFQSGMINVSELLSPSSSVEKWFTGNNFSKQIFLETCRLTERGIGPGEFALAAFSPELKGAGAKSGSGDLIYKESTFIEVKGKIKSWGRLHDAKKMRYNIPKIEAEFNKAGIDQSVLTVKVWISLRPTLDKEVVNSLAKVTVENLFTKVAPAEKTNLINLLAGGSMEDIKREWARLSFVNYKAAAGFDGILFFDTKSGASNYIEDPGTINLTGDAPQMYGPEQSAMPKVWTA